MFILNKILLGNRIIKPFALSKFYNENCIKLYTGQIIRCANLEETLNQKNTFFCVPYKNIYEKYGNFENKISSLKILNSFDFESSKHQKEIISYIKEEIDIKDLAYDCSNRDFANKIESVIDEEICKGSGTNFMLCRKINGEITNLTIKKIIGIFFRFIENEIGYYHTFCFFNGDDFIIGSSPECHLKIDNNKINFNRISGTIAKEKTDNKKIEEFIINKKETYELLMAIDEDLKMMSKNCSELKINGPNLREMSKVIHTEYEFIGTNKSNNNVKLFQDSICAATMLGSPLKSAMEVTEKYNQLDKKYYSGAIGVLNEDGSINSSIVMRSLFIKTNGNFCTFAGSSIVKESDSLKEILEIKAKLSTIIDNIQSKNINPIKIIQESQYRDNLEIKNELLNKFWFGIYEPNNSLQGIKILIINNEDDFVFMLKMIVEIMGAIVDVINWQEYSKNDDYQLTIIGPGPGDPNDKNSKKMIKINQIAKDLIKSKKKFAGICLGHQIISIQLGLKVSVGEKICQGEQKKINLFGNEEYVAFYNSFFAKYNESCKIKINTVSLDKESNELFAIRGKNFFSLQFHPESLLSQNGAEIIKNEILRIIT